MNLIGPCMPARKWGCPTYDGYPRELTQSKDVNTFPRMFVGWNQPQFTNVLLPERVVNELRRRT